MTEVCVTEDKTVVAAAASYCSVSRNPVRFKALIHISVIIMRGPVFVTMTTVKVLRKALVKLANVA